MNAKIFWLSVLSILYTYAGYPLLLAILSRFRAKAQSYTDTTPFVTLLIAAYNEEEVIAEKIENSLALDYPAHHLQILVAADGSSDRTPEIVQQFTDTRVELSYSPPRRGKMAAINRAMPQAKGEIVVFSDANNMYAPDTLRELVKPFHDSKVGAVSGAKHIIEDDDSLGFSEGAYWKYESFIKLAESRMESCTAMAGEILAIRRELFELPPDTIITDDFYMGMRIIARGYNVMYAPLARSFEQVSATASDEVERRSRNVAGRYQALSLAHRILPFNRPLVIWQVVSHKFSRLLIPFAMIGALVSNVLAVLFPRREQKYRLLHLVPPFNWMLLLLQALFYGLAYVGNRTERSGMVGKILYLPTFLVNSNIAALIGLYRFLKRSQTTNWQRVKRRS